MPQARASGTPMRHSVLGHATLVACLSMVMAGPHADAVAQPASAPAESSQVDYQVPAGSLDQVLNAFAAQSGVQVSIDGALTQGKRSVGLQGRHGVAAGFARLLRGTGLEAVPQASGNYVLRRQQGLFEAQQPARRAAGGMALPEVVVTAPRLADQATTEYSGSYAPTGPSTSATRLNLSIKETPQSVSVVTRQQMDDFGLQSLGDVMLYSPGVTSTGRNPDGGAHTFNVRGFDIENIQVDGVQGSYHAAARGSFHGIMSDTLIYDRVEVVRGATGLLSGAGDPSASVNLIRKRPQKTFGANASASIGSWSQRQVTADVTSGLTKDGAVRARLIGGWRESDSFRRWVSSDNATLTGVVEADLGRSTMLTLGHDYQRSRSNGNINGGLPLFHTDGSLTDLPRSTWLAPPWTYWNKDYNHSFVRLEHDFDSGWKALAALGHHRNHGEALVVGSAVRLGGTLQPDGSGMVLATNLASESARRQDNWELSANGPFQWLGRTHQLSLGANGSKARNTAHDIGFSPSQAAGSPAGEIAFPVPNIIDWDGSGMIEPTTWRTGAYSRTHIEQKGVFGAARFSLADPLHLIIGARWSSYKTHRDDFNTAGAYTGTAAVLRNSGEITPYAGITYDITPATTVYASYTEIFRPQSYRDKDNNFLDPIEGSNVELGIKNTLLNRRLNLNAAVFEARQDNLAEIDDSVPEFSLPDGGQAYRSTGKGGKSRGFELEANGELSRHWQAYASYTYTRTRDGRGEVINRILPRSTIRMGSQYRLPGQWSGLTLAANLQWQGRKSLTRAGQDIPGVGMRDPVHGSYLIANLGLNYRINDQWSAALNVHNLFDKKYYERTQSWGVYYGEPRNALLTVRYVY